jgi:hypothetical protein
MRDTILVNKTVEDLISRLYRNKSIIPQIYHAIPILRYEFGDSAEILIEPYHDPEFESHEVHIIVRLPEYGDKFMDRIDKVRDHLDKQGKLDRVHIGTDFQPILTTKGETQ